MVKINDYFIKGKNRPGKKLKKKKGLAFHWTGNVGKGANAKANANYFTTTTTYASTQYIVDSKEILRLMPDNELSYQVGATSYTAIGKSLMEAGYNPNYFLVGVEICVNADGDFHRAEMNAIDLGAHLMVANNWTIKDVYRHYDITGKTCPKMYIAAKEWKEFLAKLTIRYNELKKNDKSVINKELLNELSEVVKVTTKGLAIRLGPDTTYDKVGEYVLGDKVKVFDLTDGWYRTDKGWISSMYTEEVDDVTEPSIVLTDDRIKKYGVVKGLTGTLKLNVRPEPNTLKPAVGSYANGTIVELLEHKNSWYKVSNGWVSGYYIDELITRKEITMVATVNVYSDATLTTKVSTLATGKKTMLFGQTETYATIKEGFIALKTFK